MFEKIGLTFQRIAVTLFTGILFLLGCMMGTNHSDLQKDYVARVEGLTLLENDMDAALPQTEVYTYVYNHLHGALPAGKTAKKAIVIGYDGCRLDALSLMDDAHDSAIRALLADGGKVYACYCGGKPYRPRLVHHADRRVGKGGGRGEQRPTQAQRPPDAADHRRSGRHDRQLRVLRIVGRAFC